MVKISMRETVVSRNASIGIGTMVIFIAMVLVAGIAASVIIQTMNSMEQQAMRAGDHRRSFHGYFNF
jgi:flagellin FlaB